ncbi:MAG: hypothetical protein A3K22_03490 [Deltaproteobacteria bacterium RBG_16_42_7]|nr:MAG: hypothetical protein A3K22_03490 [Deltaproteobacteria bacterium RBG_16_42_7]
MRLPKRELKMNPSDLFKWRKKNGYTQIRLGKELGVTTITVYRWEKSMREIPSFLHLALECLEMKRKLSKRVVKYPKQREGLVPDKTKPEVKYLTQLKGGGEPQTKTKKGVSKKSV